MKLTEPQRKQIFDILVGERSEHLDSQVREVLEGFAARELEKIEEVLDKIQP